MSMSPESMYRLIRDRVLRAEEELRQANFLIGALDPSRRDDAALYKEMRALEAEVSKQVAPIRKRLHRMIYREEGYDENGGTLRRDTEGTP